MMDVPNGYGRTAMIVTMTTAMVGILRTGICDDSDDEYDGWDDGDDDFVVVDNGGNYDRDEFYDRR